MVNATSKLYDKLLNTYTTQYNKLPEGLKKTITVLNKPEMLSLDFTEDDSPPIPALDGGEESVETIAVRTKLNP